MKMVTLIVATLMWVAVAIAPAEQRTAAGAEVTIRRVPNGGIQPEVVRDEDGTVHLLYFAGEPQSGNLFYVRSRDNGATFSAPIQVNTQDGSAIATGTIRGGQLAVGRNGRVHVAWNGSDRAMPKGVTDPRTGHVGSQMLYTRLDADRTGFEPQRGLMQRSLTLDGGGSIAADAAGTVYVAWHGNGAETGNDGEGNRRVWIARSSDDGRTFGAETPAWTEPTGVCGCCGLRMLAGRANSLYLLYRSATALTNRDVYLLASTDDGRSFRGTRVHEWKIGACPMTSLSLTEDRSGVLAAWETAGQVYFGRVAPDRTGVTSMVAPMPPDGTGRKHPRVVSNESGQVLLVWTEGTAWARGGSVAWQGFTSKGEPAGPIGTQTGVPMWSFAGVVADLGGGFTIFY